MGEKDYRLRCINELSKVKKQKKTPLKEDLLDLFTTYIYLTNPDYKYNETYLKDMILGFWYDVSKYVDKLELREKILAKIKLVTIPNEIKIRIQIDETWDLNYNGSNWEMVIADMPKLTAVDAKKTYVKCKFINEHGIFFSDYDVFDKEGEIIKFVADTIKVVIDEIEVE